MWKARVKKVYSSLEDLRAYDEMYGICARCGYASPEAMWLANPKIQGSTNPKDLGVADETKGKKHRNEDK